uniref:Uncharacterized protein n=1 Tax=blood disease bacterium R229 TaxID=741978 RepID=G2ZMP1_9RALS|nr:hypothetical protein BDB_90002 [blood disease bacterium R229]
MVNDSHRHAGNVFLTASPTKMRTGSSPLLCEVSPEYDGETPEDDAWNTPPPGLTHLPS